MNRVLGLFGVAILGAGALAATCVFVLAYLLLH